MDKNDLDHALHEIRQRALVAIDTMSDLRRSEAQPAIFQPPSEDSEMLSFCLYDLHTRIVALKDGLWGGARA